MRSLIVGDVHITDKNYDYSARLFDGIASIYQELKLDCIKFLGDIYNQRSLIRTNHQRLLVRGMAKLAKAGCKQVDIVVGNHDLDSLEDGDAHSLEVLEWLFGGMVRVHNKIFVDRDYLYIPYMTDLDKVKAALDKHRDRAKYVYCHLPVSGFFLAQFHKETHGVNPADFARYSKVFVGHFHIPQEDGNIIYPGSVFVNTFAEAGVTPHMILHDDATSEISFINTRRLVPDAPLYHIINTNVTLVNFDPKVNWGNAHLKFIIEGEDIKECKATHQKILESLSGQDCHLQFQYKTAKIFVERISEHLSLEAMFLKHIKEVHNDDPEIKRRGLEYIGNIYADV